VEDPYKVPLEKVMRTSDPEGHKKAGHDIPFKPAKTVKDKPYKAPYEHLTDRVEVKKNYKDADGHVVIEPKNFYTSPAKKGRVGKLTYFTPQPEHLPDDYNYPKTLALKEFKEAKKLEQEKLYGNHLMVFKQNSLPQMKMKFYLLVGEVQVSPLLYWLTR
jgi:hypothetical protein